MTAAILARSSFESFGRTLPAPASLPVRLRRPPSPPGREHPVVLLHGFASSPRVLLPLERHLRRELGREVWRVPISAGREDLRESARRVHGQLEAFAATHDVGFFDMVGHSMGGLVATWLLKRLDEGRRLRAVVTLGTPHRGTPVARLGAAVLGGVCPALAQMAPGSPLLDELKWLAVPDGCDLVSIAASHDALVPDDCARLTPLPGHRNVRVGGVHHTSLLFSRSVFSIVSELLGAPVPALTHLADAA